jgi:hypothetical protein
MKISRDKHKLCGPNGGEAGGLHMHYDGMEVMVQLREAEDVLMTVVSLSLETSTRKQ